MAANALVTTRIDGKIKEEAALAACRTYPPPEIHDMR